MKQTTVNEFKDALNLDLHPLVTPKTVLTDNLNGTFITYNGNEFCLQNDRGNEWVANLTSGYTPIGIKEHNGILYIVSVNGNKAEIGTFPSPDYTIYNEIEDDYEDNVFSKDKYNERVFGKDAKWNLFDEQHPAEYHPLHILVNRAPFTNQLLKYNTKTPVTIEVQDSYDGSVNLILVADGIKTRIINSGFSVLPNNQYKFVNRNQSVETNIYDDVDRETELIRTSDVITNIDLQGVQSGGQFKGGNYTFYIKFGDADFNQTDVVAESGIVSIFNGNDGVPSTISGTLLDERTDKMIHLRIIGLNKVYSKIYIYYSREYSDTQGFRMTEYGMFSEPIDLTPDVENGVEKDYQSIWLTGFEQTTPIDSEVLNIDYHTVDWARAETQHSNMLFLGNVGQEEMFQLYQDLQEIADKINIIWSQDANNINIVSYDYKDGDEYYSTKNIYNYVGYYPGEIYRFGIVFILKDGSKSPVFNMPGRNFQGTQDQNGKYPELKKGVCLMPNVDVITQVPIPNSENSEEKIKPLYLHFSNININNDNIKGWFIVRQKRIPNTICEGLSIAVDSVSNTPMVWDGEYWVSQSFLASDRIDSEDFVQLEYNSAQKNIVDQASNEDFPTWFDNNNYQYDQDYWLDLNEEGNLYSLPTGYADDPNDTPSQQIERAITTIINGLGITRSFSVYTNTSGFVYNDYDEEQELQKQLNMLQGSVMLYWYRKYSLGSIDNTTKIPTDVSTNDYVVGIIPNLKEYNSIPVTKGNLYYYRVLQNRFNSSHINKTLQRKFIKHDQQLTFEVEANALLSLDPCVKQNIASILDGSQFYINLERKIKMDCRDSNSDYKNVFEAVTKDINALNNASVEMALSECKSVFVSSNTNIKVIDDYEFSNVAGDPADISKYKPFSTPFFVGLNDFDNTGSTFIVNAYELLKSKLDPDRKKQFYDAFYTTIYGSNKNINLLRGLFTPYIGLANKDEITQGVYSIKHKKIDSNSTSDFLIREQDNSEYYAVTDYLKATTNSINCYRGDCFTNTVTMRIIRNFIDPVAPAVDIIVDPDGWHNYVCIREKDAISDDGRVQYENVNLTDVNTVDLGLWVTFKCLSSYNLGLRSKDTFHTDEMAILGSPRSFYPLNGASTATGNKMEESYLLNDGLSATVGRKRYNLLPDIPYSKSEFSNRIMFSNVNVTDAFTNGYRTFQGLAYKDYDKQYGAITKLISLGQNIFVVMEHGLGLVPVNPKALLQTTTGEAIHIYGYGVLPDEMTIISQDYGSKYEHSVIRTPIGIYGIDVDARKIWRFSDKQGFETISDMKIETYLKDNLEPLVIEMGLKDIRTHYNGKKGDLMFTWNDKNGTKLFSICYNERQNLWTTRYNWKPTVSENINDEFYSLNNEAIWDHSDFSTYEGHVSSWYNNKKGFEFEFVVSDPIGVNKIFDNLQIISNNVQPEEMEITVIGDDYEFKRDEVVLNPARANRLEIQTDNSTNIRTTSNVHGNEVDEPTSHKQPESSEDNPKFWTYKFDKRLNQSALVKWQPFKDIYKFGRRIGNIQYKEGSWFAQIEPLRINNRKEARIRDKWAKIRIRYSGKDLAVITAIKTLINI